MHIAWGEKKKKNRIMGLGVKLSDGMLVYQVRSSVWHWLYGGEQSCVPKVMV